jgi:hypothetical protein
MPKKSILSPFYVNVLIIVLLIMTSVCCLFCDDIKENITKSEPECSGNDCDKKEKYRNWAEPPINNGFTPQWWNNMVRRLGNNQDIVYNGAGYNNRSQAFYNQGWYPDMVMPPQVIGCGGRRQPCLGGTQEVIPVVNDPIEISERNIAPVNIIATSPYEQVGVQIQVGVLYKVFGSLNEIFPLYGVRRYRNSDTWDYSTKVGKEGNFVQVKVLTRRGNNNELQTNDQVRIDGNSSKFRVTMYDQDFPQYNPYFKR